MGAGATVGAALMPCAIAAYAGGQSAIKGANIATAVSKPDSQREARILSIIVARLFHQGKHLQSKMAIYAELIYLQKILARALKA